MIVKAKIEFEFDTEQIQDAFGDVEWTEEELIEYCKETYYEDIMSLYKYSELFDAIEVEVVNE